MTHNHIKLYLKYNLNLLILTFATTTGIMLYKYTLNPILITLYSFGEHNLSIGNVLFVFGGFIAPFIGNWLLEHRVNFVKIIKIILIIIIVMLISDYIAIIKTNIYQYYSNRFIDGMSYFLIYFIIGNYLDLKLILNERKSTVIGFQITINYIIKLVIPIFGAFLLEHFYPLINLFLYILINLFLIIYISKNEKRMLLEYIRYAKQKLKLKLNTTHYSLNSFFHSLNLKKIIVLLFEDKDKRNYLFFSEMILKGMFRGYYDFFLLLYLTIHLHYSLIQGVSLVAVNVFATSFAFFIGIFFDKLSIKTYFKVRFIFETIFVISIILLMNIINLNLNEVVVIILLFLLGLTRLMEWDYQARTKFYFSKKLSINNIKIIFDLLFTLSVLVSYGIITFLFYWFNNDYTIILYLFEGFAILNFLLLCFIYLKKLNIPLTSLKNNL